MIIIAPSSESLSNQTASAPRRRTIPLGVACVQSGASALRSSVWVKASEAQLVVRPPVTMIFSEGVMAVAAKA